MLGKHTDVKVSKQKHTWEKIIVEQLMKTLSRAHRNLTKCPREVLAKPLFARTLHTEVPCPTTVKCTLVSQFIMWEATRKTERKRNRCSLGVVLIYGDKGIPRQAPVWKPGCGNDYSTEHRTLRDADTGGLALGVAVGGGVWKSSPTLKLVT